MEQNCRWLSKSSYPTSLPSSFTSVRAPNRRNLKLVDKRVRMGMVLARKGPLGLSPVSSPNPTHSGSLCYIALRSVERFVEMLGDPFVEVQFDCTPGKVLSIHVNGESCLYRGCIL